jgi:chromosome partitioning protein
MGLFNRGSKHDRREATRDDTGAELAELGEAAPEPTPEPVREEVEPVNEERPQEPAPVEDELRTVEEADEQPEVHVAPIPEPPDHAEERAPEPGGSGREAEQPTGGISREAEQPTGVISREAEEPMGGEDAEARVSFEDALSPRRPAATGVADTSVERNGDGSNAKVISFANQKGGVAKTTTTLNLAVAFAESGHRVLCVDLDPQGNLTMSQGIDPDKVEKSMYDVLVHHIPIREVIHEREIDIAVASIDLAGAEIAMSTQIGRERSLEKALAAVSQDYDFVCVDTPPSLGLLTVNALTASDKVIVPVQCEYLSMRGLMQLQGTLEMIRENLNPRVQIEGILPTMLDSRTVHAKEAVEILEENFGELVFKSRIKKAIKFAEAPVRGSSVLKYDPKSNAADYYRELAKEVLTHGAS